MQPRKSKPLRVALAGAGMISWYHLVAWRNLSERVRVVAAEIGKRLRALEPDLWKAQNIFYERAQAIASLSREALEPEWLREFRKLGEALGMADLLALPAARSEPESRLETHGTQPASDGAAATPLVL